MMRRTVKWLIAEGKKWLKNYWAGWPDLMHKDRFRQGDLLQDLAIFIMRHADGTHTGILHRSGNRVYILDQMWHERTRGSSCTAPPHPFVEPSIEPEEINDITGICRLIHARINDATKPVKIPYAFQFSQQRFNNITGELMLGDGFGLSCSTFVMAVFASAYVYLVDLENWPARENDVERHEKYVTMMEDGIPDFAPPAAPEHVENVKGEVRCSRVRPEEVAGSGLADELPASFDAASEAGDWILAQL